MCIRDRFMKTQPKQISEQTVPMIKTEKDTEDKKTKKAVSYTHLDVYKRQK